MLNKISNLFGVQPMYVPCGDSKFVAGPKTVCEYKSSTECGRKGFDVKVTYTYDTRNGERCTEKYGLCC